MGVAKKQKLLLLLFLKHVLMYNGLFVVALKKKDKENRNIKLD